MISTDRTRVKIKDVVSSQLPSFVRDSYPLLTEFLQEYYSSQEYSGSVLDLLQNIDQYFDLDALTNYTKNCVLSGDLDSFSTTITTVYNPSRGLLGTYGFPERYGLLKIDNEIILYKSKTQNTFEECVRGFSGITKYQKGDDPEQLVFSETDASSHTDESTIENLSTIFLEKFLRRIKEQFLPGFEDRDISPKVNQKTLIGKISDFYDSKGTEESIRILFGILYGENVKVLNPKDFLFKPSSATFRKTKDIVVESLEGDPTTLRNRTLYQDSIPEYGINKAEGSVADVEEIKTDNKTYYRIKLDYEYDQQNSESGGSFSPFTPHPHTKTTSKASVGSTSLDVDSTVGFPTSGNLVVSLATGDTGILSYKSKSLTQFFDVNQTPSTISIGSTIRLDASAYGYPGISTSEVVRVRIGSVLKDVKFLDDGFYFSNDDQATITYPGIANTSFKSNDWVLNTPLRYSVSKVSLIDSSNFTYTIKTLDDTIFTIQDNAVLFDEDFNEIECLVTSVTDRKTFTVKSQSTLSLTQPYTIERKIRKSSVVSTLTNYSYVNNYNSDVQNVYSNFSGDVLVSSPSIPSYKNQPLSFYDKKISLNGSYNSDSLTITDVNDHGLYTGDAVYYKPGLLPIILDDEEGGSSGLFTESKLNDFSEGTYFVKRLNQNQIKLARSRSDIQNNNFLSIVGVVTSNTIEPNSTKGLSLKTQNLLRVIKEPENVSGTYETPFDSNTGIFVNGVELTNYKSSDFIRFGEILSSNVSKPGENYDVINPPILRIFDSVGVGATGTVSVTGNLKRIEIIDTGFDYVSDPIIDITGGNGYGAEAKVNTTLIKHSVSFSATEQSAFVNPSNNTIGFSTYHKFRSVEPVIYKTNGESGILGLTTNSTYYAKVIDSNTIRLFNTENDASLGINTVSINGYGIGVHEIESLNSKRIITSVSVINPGTNYQNKERTCNEVGIVTSINSINIKNHGYNSGEIVTYSTTGSSISGLSSSSNYVVTKVDDDNFKLSNVGLSSEDKYAFYKTNQYVNLTSTGSGTHIFNYEPITVSIIGRIGVSTFSNQNFNAVLQPIFRGTLDSVNVSDGGIGYGSSEVLNYDRQPNYELLSGKDAELIPIVNDGSITEVIVNYSGEQYNTSPDLLIQGDGRYAILTPVLENGRIKSIKVINGGTGYNLDTTSITVVPSGSGGGLEFQIKQWNVNLVEKNLNIISSDDGILKRSLNSRYEVQYCHAYAPRKLRESVYQKTQDNKTQYGVFDLQKVNGQESTSSYHSPIIGWAYDGNPIYGPYGFTSKTGGTTRLMKSGYKLVSQENRPQFPLGFFIEDYQFDNTGDLDEHNGRYCVTPEYPNGTYAYFTTIDDSSVEDSGTFISYRKPVFPYVIGNTFKSKPIEFNFDKLSNQDDFDITSENKNERYPGPWLRNTTLYNIQSENTFYDYFNSPLKDNTYKATIRNTSEGQVESIKIVDSGDGYKVGDKIVFNNFDTGGKSAAAIVSEVNGKTINSVSCASSIIYDVEVLPIDIDGRYVAYSNSPHNLLNNDLVVISGINTYSDKIQGSYNIGVTSERYSLVSAIGNTSVTGIVTYISLSGFLSRTKLRENDILQIDTEKVKVLNLDPISSRIRVLRGVEGTTGTAHTAGTFVTEVSRKFAFISLPESDIVFERNKEIYFNPQESVGLGTVSGVGIGSTIVFTNVGAGITQIFIPTRSIYLPQHNILTGESITYSNNSGTSIVVSNGSTTFSLQDSSVVYAAKISDNLLGISTVQIGIGTTGTFVGVGSTNIGQQLLYFTDFGAGVYHNFRTNKNNSVKCQVTKNIVTVSTASTHNLEKFDTVNIKVQPSTTTTVVLKYNDYHRRVVANPRTFLSSDVDVLNNTIFIENHKLITGDPIIHTSTSPSGGLEDQKIYYVIAYTKDLIKLSPTKYGTEIFERTEVNISSASSGTISPVNPKLDLVRNSRVVFDLSDSSLSSTYASNLYSAFELELYTDEDFTQKFYGTLSANSFNITNTGEVGISSNSTLTLTIDDRVPSKLFYKLTPINLEFISDEKKQIITDKDVSSNNLLNINSSKYSGKYIVSGIGSTTFNYYLPEVPESLSYTSQQSSLTYTTSSTQTSGGISSVKINYGGYGYKQIPGISTVSTNSGFGAILEPFSSGIGTIINIQTNLIGYDYPVDKTLRPSCNLPEVFKVLPFNKISFIGVTSAGNGYSLSPNLVLIDGYANTVVEDVDLRYTLGKTSVDILKNTSGINGEPKIIPTNNSNGIKINSITFNPTTKDVSVGLNTGFSDVFPLSVGDKILIENVSVGIATTGKGYNSENYNFELFTITEVPAGNTGLGGNVGIVTFNMSDFLQGNEFPGVFDPLNSYGRLIAEKDFPIFDIQLKKNSFAKGETIISDNKFGIVESWNDKVNILKLSSSNEFFPGDIIKGYGTKTSGLVGEKYNFQSYVDTGAVSERSLTWDDEVGFLSNNLQRIQNNEYYQNFSYSLSSKIQYNDWENAVSSLSHNSGYVKFSDLQIESTSSRNASVLTPSSGSNVDVFNDFVKEIDLSCYNDYDSVFENKLNISNRTVSSEIYFSNRVLTDYFESVGNRVLIIDDISDQFNSEPRPTPYSVIDQFDITQKVKKYFTYIRDKRFTGERQSLFVSVVHNGSTAYLNQYGRVETSYDLGSFDVSFDEASGYLLFYPTLYEVNDFDVSYISFDIDSTISGVGNTSLGDSVKIETQQVSVPASSTGTVISIGTSYRASKVIVHINSDDGRQEFDELNILHDGSNVEILEYGQITTSNFDSYEPSGLGTYSTLISGSDLNVQFTPVSGIGVTVNSIIVSIADTSSSGVGTITFGFDGQSIAFIDSTITSIASTSSPTENVIAKYSNSSGEDQHDASYFLICVEDITNGNYQLSEAILIDDDSQTYLTEYGNIETVSGLGTVGAGAGTTFTELYFTPNPNIDVQVRVFQASLQLVNPTPLNPELYLDLNNGEINVGFGNYRGTFSDVRREFGLTHGGRNIFQRYFFGNDSEVVNVAENTINVPEHFFVTGEELVYTHAGTGNTQAIGIAATDFGVGIGTTTFLPSKVFVVRLDDKRIKLARNVEDALKTNPVVLDITHVGIGTSHTFTAKNQNGKCLIAIDNFIQSPIIPTATTTGLSTNVTLVDNIIKFTGINSFFGGDLIKIDDEIMKIDSVGFGSTNQILVKRPWMGTGLSTHSQYSTVTKLQGNYNIVNNNINFVDAPRGPIPIGSSTNAPDERDWTGITTHSKFQGRSFLRNGLSNSNEEPYSRNYIFDDISEQFDSLTKTFTIKSNGQNVTGFSTNNSIILVNGIFQVPQSTLVETQNYTLTENSGITSITFLGTATSTSYDPNTATIPVGGIIVSVGSTGGFGYQPLVSAGGTAIVSSAGTITSVSIGNSGSGYRSGIQTVVNVGVYTSSLSSSPTIEFIGTAAISGGNIVSVAITNPGVGYTSSNPPSVVFDAPLSYSNIPLVYSSSGPTGFGTEARVDIVVGQGSSVVDFEISNLGYSYGNNQILTIETGGLSGIPTDQTKPFSEFQIRIEKISSDGFSGWNIGELEVFDKIEDEFDGFRTKFTISKNNSPVTIRSKKGSNIDVQATLLVFLNNILQVPGEGYTFTGGSVITFSEAPKPPADGIEGTGDICDIFFYKGSGEVDVQFTDVLETVKIGDSLTINDNDTLCQSSIQEDERLVTDVISSDTVQTNPYIGPGITDDPNCVRTVTWCQQRNDKLIDGKIVGKSRILYEPVINPVSYLIQNIGSASTVAYVDSVKPLYDSVSENTTSLIRNKITIVSQDSRISAAATAVVSAAGTVSSINVTDAGVGYVSNPVVTISNPVGLGTTQRAIASATISDGSVNSIIVSYGGTGYTSSNPPIVLVEPPTLVKETSDITSYSGDDGVIVGFGTTTIGGNDRFIFDLFIPIDSYLRNPSFVSVANTISSLISGDYFVVHNSNVGFASTEITSVDGSFNTVAVGTSFIDNVYYVESVEVVERIVASPGLGGTTGIGNTYVLRVFSPVSGISTITFDSSTITMDSDLYTMDSASSITYSGTISTTTTSSSISFGEFSWGKIFFEDRNSTKSFNFYGNNGVSGITSSSIVSRTNSLRYNNYI